MPEKQISMPRRIALFASGLLLFALTALFIDTVIDIWPAVGVQSEICKKAEAMPPAEREPFLVKMRDNHKVNCRFKDTPIARVNLGGTHTYLSPDQGLFGLVAIFAALAALLRSLFVTVWDGAGRSEKGSSIVWNLVRPFVGGALALVVYVILRALFLPPGTLTAANPYGFIAVAALVGLFCEEMLCWAIARGKALTSS